MNSNNKEKWYTNEPGVKVAKRHYSDWVLYSDVICLMCGRQWEVNISSFKLDKGCPKCRPNLFVDYVRQRYTDG